MLVAGHSIFQICQPVRGADPVMHQAPMLEMSLAAERLDTCILGVKDQQSSAVPLSPGFRRLHLEPYPSPIISLWRFTFG